MKLAQTRHDAIDRLESSFAQPWSDGLTVVPPTHGSTGGHGPGPAVPGEPPARRPAAGESRS